MGKYIVWDAKTIYIYVQEDDKCRETDYCDELEELLDTFEERLRIFLGSQTCGRIVYEFIDAESYDIKLAEKFRPKGVKP